MPIKRERTQNAGGQLFPSCKRKEIWYANQGVKSEHADLFKRMTTWFYYDKNGQKQGPISGGKLKGFAKVGLIEPETLVEAESGKTVPARKIHGLTFLITPPVQSDASDSGTYDPFAHPISVPAIHDSEQESDIFAFATDDLGLSPKPEQGIESSADKYYADTHYDKAGQNSLSLNRAVFIFLAVFVGILGIHDFYAKRARQGIIHLGLLLPWILAVSISILAVFGWTLYAWTYAPLRKEIRECEQTIKDCVKEIAETEQKLEDVLEGKLRGQRRQPDAVRVEPDRRVNPPVRDDAQNRNALKQPNVDWQFAAELRNLLQELRARQEILQGNLENLEIKRGALKSAAWIPAGSLWLYFLFMGLPFISWVMAMVEIVYVTKDGTGQEFSC
jgi:hypothetical protein